MHSGCSACGPARARQLHDGRGRSDRRDRRALRRLAGSFSEFAPRAKFVHIDVDPAEISEDLPAPSRSSATPDVVPRLTAEYRSARPTPTGSRLVGAVEGSARSAPAELRDSDDTEVEPQSWSRRSTRPPAGLIVAYGRRPAPDARARSCFHFDKPRRWINSGGLGSMDFGLPARWARRGGPRRADLPDHRRHVGPDRTRPELDDADRDGIPVKVFIMNNGYWAWSGSGRSCSGTAATRTSTWLVARLVNSPRLRGDRHTA